MRDRWLIRGDMIEMIGHRDVERDCNASKSAVDKWREDPQQSGARPNEFVTDYMMTHLRIPSALKWEYGMSFVQPAGFTVIQRSGLEALLDGRAYSGENHLADICACGTPLVWMVRDGKAKSFCVRCSR